MLVTVLGSNASLHWVSNQLAGRVTRLQRGRCSASGALPERRALIGRRPPNAILKARASLLLSAGDMLIWM